MAITFPLAVENFADLLRIASVSWFLRDSQELSGLGNGQILAADLAPRLWEGNVTTGRMTFDEAMDMQALIESLDGALNTFYLYNPLRKYPREDPDGSILGAATPVIASLDANNKAMTVSGLPANYVLSRGDMLAFDYGSPARRALHRVVETVTASGAGLSPLFEVRPHIRTGAAVADDIILAKPAAKVIMQPGSFSIENDTLNSCIIKFSVIQRL